MNKIGRRNSSTSIIGNRIKELLKIKGMTITELSKAIGYARSGVSTAINANRMDTMMLDAIARHLDCSEDYLKGIESAHKPKYDFSLPFDTLDSQGNIIPSYNKIAKNRIDILQEYLILLGQRGIEDIDSGYVYEWPRETVTNKCDMIFEFRFMQYIRDFLKNEQFFDPKPSKEARIIEEGDNNYGKH